ncbi:sulfatase-like hydrolase/transferase [uncultured Desulfobulbus sp.]|uniref:sulfatase-like hydrolase/transferase n=1 Tax=uncultured Desulfobulbus sp. TaxID=239745 RepID=UPI0029C7EB65|nr:sulfatase-like hydrolase/transferase [uncultured Desulfobulbus sp.]
MAATCIAATLALKARFVANRTAYLLFNRYTVFLLGVYAYSLIILALGGLGGMFGAIEVQSMWLFQLDELRGVYLKREYLELILLFYFYCYFNMILRPSRWQALLAAVPLFLAYLGQDIYFLMYSSVFRFAELSEVPELFRVLSWPYIAMLLVFVVLPLGFFLWSINYRRFVVLIAGALPPALLICAAVYFPEQYTSTYRKVGEEIVYWSDADSAENNGRFMMLLFREAERHLMRVKTETFRNRPQYDEQAQQLAGWIRTNGNKRNVHLVVMESFLDPTLFKGATYTKDPFHPNFKKLFGNKMGFSLSPVVGGKTAQAEFEILCGAPAFEEMSGVEFNSFTGSAAHCLPGTLQLAGYQTMASNAYNPSFFNAPTAYRGVGFAKMFFPREYANGSDTYLAKGDTSGEKEYMFDGTIFSQNIDFITPFLKDNDGPPLFNYVLTIYGHFPHLLNEEKRPQLLKMISDFKDPQLERAANQMFYRSEAVADYVNRLLTLDAKSLIILVSDHLPPGQHGRRSFQKLRYLNNTDDSLRMNRIMIIEEGKVKKFATIHHYDIPAMVLNSITKGAYCKEHSCGFAENKLLDDRMKRHDDYMRVMAHASE